MTPGQRIALLNASAFRPSLDLNFLAGAFGSRIAFTRASAAWDFDASGNLAQFGTNVPRVGPQGLLVEEQRTNAIRNPRCEGAVAGTPGTMPTNWGTGSPGGVGISQQVIGSGIESGIPYVDVRFFGTTTGAGFSPNFDTNNAIPASNGQTWTIAGYYRLVAGDASAVTFTQGYQELSSAFGFLTAHSSPAFTVSSAPLASQRQSFTVTNNQSACAFLFPYYGLRFSSGVTIDLTVRIGLPQLEQGASATSPIMPPAGSPAASTRAGDIPYVPVGSWYNPNAGTLLVEGTCNNPAATAVFAQFDDNTSQNRFRLGRLTSGNVFYDSTASGTGNPLIQVPSPALGAITKIAQSYSGGNFAGAVNGALMGASSGAAFVGMQKLSIAYTQPTDGYTRRVRYWPRALSAFELQGVTT